MKNGVGATLCGCLSPRVLVAGSQNRYQVSRQKIFVSWFLCGKKYLCVL